MANISQIIINNKTYDLQDTIAKKDINEFSERYPIFKVYTSDNSVTSEKHAVSTTGSDTSLYKDYDKLQIRKIALMNDSCSLYALRAFILAKEPSTTGQFLSTLFMKKAKSKGFEAFTGWEKTSHMLIRRRVGIGTIRTTSSHIQFLNPLEYRYWNFAVGIKASMALADAYSSLQSYILTRGTASWEATTGTNTISRNITIS